MNLIKRIQLIIRVNMNLQTLFHYYSQVLIIFLFLFLYPINTLRILAIERVDTNNEVIDTAYVRWCF